MAVAVRQEISFAETAPLSVAFPKEFGSELASRHIIFKPMMVPIGATVEDPKNGHAMNLGQLDPQLDTSIVMYWDDTVHPVPQSPNARNLRENIFAEGKVVVVLQ